MKSLQREKIKTNDSPDKFVENLKLVLNKIQPLNIFNSHNNHHQPELKSPKLEEKQQLD